MRRMESSESKRDCESIETDRVVARAEACAAVLRLARGLAAERRTLDLAGLDNEIGRLCASALDLSPGSKRDTLPKLADVLREIDALGETLRNQRPPHGGPTDVG